jgi:hypothetical protein
MGLALLVSGWSLGDSSFSFFPLLWFRSGEILQGHSRSHGPDLGMNGYKHCKRY